MDNIGNNKNDRIKQKSTKQSRKQQKGTNNDTGFKQDLYILRRAKMDYDIYIYTIPGTAISEGDLFFLTPGDKS